MEDDFNDFSELSAGDTSIALRRCFAQVAAERDQLRAEVDRLREKSGVEEDGNKYLVSRWSLAEQLKAATARAEASEALLAVLRGALEEIAAHGLGMSVVWAKAALALTAEAEKEAANGR